MIIIPARLASTRFEQKILRPINKVPMFVATAQNAQKIDSVAVACDDEKVLEISQKFGIKAVLTSQNHQSGTDRINEACEILGVANDEIIINVQADEPFFETQNLAKFREFATNSIKNGAFMASCYKQISQESAGDPNLVKVVLDKDSNAIYFSRSLIPYPRSKFDDYKGHIGIYAYSVANLREFCTLKTNELEDAEKLEQLRAISSGKKIAMLQICTESMGIDTLEDYLKASKIFGFEI